MKKAELEQLAEQIAQQETIIQTSKDSNKIIEAQNRIEELCNSELSFEDLIFLDEIIMEKFDF